MIVAIGGPPGGGKSTAARLYAERTGCALVSAGAVFRERAEAAGMTLEQFGTHAEVNPEVDRELDELVIARAVELSRAGDVVTDGRLQAALLTRRGIEAFRVLITAPLDVRAERVAGRDGIPVEEAKRRIVGREASERRRYRDYYDVDASDTVHYDLTLDSTTLTPDEIVDRIQERAVA